MRGVAIAKPSEFTLSKLFLTPWILEPQKENALSQDFPQSHGIPGARASNIAQNPQDTDTPRQHISWITVSSRFATDNTIFSPCAPTNLAKVRSILSQEISTNRITECIRFSIQGRIQLLILRPGSQEAHKVFSTGKTKSQGYLRSAGEKNMQTEQRQQNRLYLYISFISCILQYCLEFCRWQLFPSDAN